MKKLLLTVLVLFPLLTQAAAPLGSGWTSTTNPATARTALGAVSTNQFQTNLTAQAGTNTALQTQITARIPSSSGSGTNILLVAPTVKAAGGLILDVRDSANEQVATWENDGNISLSNLPSDPSHVITKGYADALAFGSGDSTNGVNTVLNNFISVQAQTNALKLTALRGPGTSNIFDVPTMTNPVVAVSVGISRLFFGDSFDIISDGSQISFNRLDGPNEIFSYNNSTDTFFIQEKLSVTEQIYVSAGQDPLAFHVEGGITWFSNNTVNLGRAGFYTTIDTNGSVTAPAVTITNLSTNSLVGTAANTKDLISLTKYSIIATNVAGNTNTLVLSTNGSVITATHTWTNSASGGGGGSGNTNNWAAWSSAESTNLPTQNAVLRIVGGGQTYILPSVTNAHGLVYLVYLLNADEEDTVTFQTYSGGDYINETTDDTLEVPGDFQGIYLIYGNTNYFGSVGEDVSWTIWPLGGDAATWATDRNAGGNSLTNLASITLDGDGAGEIFLGDDDNDAGVFISAPAVVDATYRILPPTNAASGFLYGTLVDTNVHLAFLEDDFLSKSAGGPVAGPVTFSGGVKHISSITTNALTSDPDAAIHYLWIMDLSASGYGNFETAYTTPMFTNSARSDRTLSSGYNMFSSAATEPYFADSLETFFHIGSQNFMEKYWQFGATNGKVVRSFMAQLDRETGLAANALQAESHSFFNGTNGGQLTIDSSTGIQAHSGLAFTSLSNNSIALRQRNFAGDGYVQIAKVNTNNAVSLGDAAGIVVSGTSALGTVTGAGATFGTVTATGGVLTGGAGGLDVFAGGSGQSISFNPSGNGAVTLATARADDMLYLNNANAVGPGISLLKSGGLIGKFGAAASWSGGSSADMMLGSVLNIVFFTGYSGTEFARFTANNVLIGGTTDISGTGGLKTFGTTEATTAGAGALQTAGGIYAAKKIIAGTSISPSASAVTWTAGSGSPESVVAAPIGSLYSRTDGGADTSFYVKESGAGNTGWVAK